ncbi:MAG TPA: four helix bundle protein [Saprospiraceae bacterium]|nr:four helix bundle protein [Saprospiraceae bacterium]
MKPHKNLLAWIRSFEVVKEIYIYTNAFPQDERFGLTSQIRRAAVSGPVNVAEGAARKGSKEFIQFLYISLGSATELDTLILLSSDLGYIPIDEANKIVEKLDHITKLIYGLIKKKERDT